MNTDKNPNPLPISKCPTCGYEMDCATAKDGNHNPSPGDYSVCLSCGEIMVFDDNLKLRVPSLAELMAGSEENHKDLEAAQRLIRRMRPLSHKRR